MVMVRLQKLVNILVLYIFFEKHILTCETKSCCFNVSLLTVMPAESVSKQVGLTGVSGVDLQLNFFHSSSVITL